MTTLSAIILSLSADLTRYLINGVEAPELLNELAEAHAYLVQLDGGVPS